jgi:hypothetical protein
MKPCAAHLLYESTCNACVSLNIKSRDWAPDECRHGAVKGNCTHRDCEFSHTKRASVLERAIEIVNSERQAEYGDPVENRVRAALVSAGMGRSLSPRDIVLSELSTKIVRVGRGNKEDTKVDLAGYAEILDRIDRAEASGELKKIAQTLLPWLF